MKNAWGDDLADAAGATNEWGDEAVPAAAPSPGPEPAPIAQAPDPTQPQSAPGPGMDLSRVDAHLERAKKAFSTLMTPIAWAGERLDRYAGSPTRAGIYALQEGKGLGGAAEAFGDQFGAPSAQAPTGKDIAARAGLSTVAPSTPPQPFLPTGPNAGYTATTASPAAAAGLIIDLLADPTNFIPGGTAVKFGAKGAGKTMGMAAKGVGMAAEGAGRVAAAAADVALPGKVGTKAKNVVKGTFSAAEKGFEDLMKGAKARWGADLSPEFKRSLEVATRNKIDPELLPESIVYGPNSPQSRITRVRAENPAIGKELLDRHEKGLQAVQDAIRSNIDEMSGGKAPGSSFEAGELIKAAYDSKVDETLGRMDVTYKALAEAAPGARIPAPAMAKLEAHLSALEKEAIDMGVDAFDDVTESQANHILKTIEKVRNAGDNLGSVTRGLQGLGRTAFKVKTPLGQIPPDVRKLRTLYGELSEAVTEGAGAAFGKDAADKLRSNNAVISELFGDKALIPSLGDVSKSPEQLFKSLILQGDAKRITTLKKYLTPEQVGQIKGAFINSLIKENPQGEFTFRMLHNALRGKKEVARALFDAGELDNIQDLIELGDKFGPAVSSTSGTGASIQAVNMMNPKNWPAKAEQAFDASRAAKQREKATRAIGFEAEGTSGRAAAKTGQPPPAMGFTKGRLSDITAGVPNPRAQAAKLYYLTERDEDKKRKK